MIGSLSHLMNHTVIAYQPLPDFPETAPPQNVRDPPVIENEPALPSSGKGKKSDFWADSEEESGEGSQESYTSGEEEQEG